MSHVLAPSLQPWGENLLENEVAQMKRSAGRQNSIMWILEACVSTWASLTGLSATSTKTLQQSFYTASPAILLVTRSQWRALWSLPTTLVSSALLKTPDVAANIHIAIPLAPMGEWPGSKKIEPESGDTLAAISSQPHVFPTLPPSNSRLP